MSASMVQVQEALKRPVLRYHGGKWMLAPWVISHFPEHRIYVEPFGGAASVLMRKPRSYAEVYNDLDEEIVNVFRILRDPVAAGELERLLRLTPFARGEFEQAYVACDVPLERARRTIIKSFMGFASSAITRPSRSGMRTRASVWKSPTGFRADSNKSGTTPAHDWSSYPAHLRYFCARLSGVVIENKPALEVMQTHDRADTLHYVDPPYVYSSRGGRHEYRHEMSDHQHKELAEVLRRLRGMVVLSAYPCDLYDRELYPDWRRFEISSMADGARRRTEVLHLNPAAYAARERERVQLRLQL